MAAYVAGVSRPATSNQPTTWLTVSAFPATKSKGLASCLASPRLLSNFFNSFYAYGGVGRGCGVGRGLGVGVGLGVVVAVAVGVADGGGVIVAVAVGVGVRGGVIVAVGVGVGVPPGQVPFTLNTMCMFGNPMSPVGVGTVTPQSAALR